MALLQIFKSTLPHCNYVFQNGKQAIFTNGVFRTDIPSEIAELENEIVQKHPNIYRDVADMTIESELVDPMKMLRHKIEQEIRAEMAAANNPNNDRGEYVQGAVKPASTFDIAAATIGSGSELAAKLASSKK